MDEPRNLRLGAPLAEFRHEALFYAGDGEFLQGVGSFIREGLEADEPTLVVLSDGKIEALRSELGRDADRVAFADMGEVGANPARIIPAWRAFVDARSARGRRLRGVGEPISPERGAAELVECQRHESLLNLAFGEAEGFFLMCPYDTAQLDRDVLWEARRSHPHLTSGGVSRESGEYRGLEAIAAPFAERLEDPPVRPVSRVFQAGTLAALRNFVRERAARAGFSAEVTEDLVLAVHELATNSVLHGGGGGILRAWSDGDALICEISDTGLIADPLVGRRPPTTDQVGGYGVWLANQLCDLVQVRSFAGGSVVRVHMHPAKAQTPSAYRRALSETARRAQSLP